MNMRYFSYNANGGEESLLVLSLMMWTIRSRLMVFSGGERAIGRYLYLYLDC